jgi:hypothetical protein
MRIPRFVKIYMGYVESYSGRDDGYPEQKCIIFYDLESLAMAKTFPNEQVFEVSEATIPEHIIPDARCLLEANAKLAEKAVKMAQLERLKKELGVE